MSREIRFRAWDEKEEKFWHDFRLHPLGYVQPANKTDGSWWLYDQNYPQDQIVLEQFTGLKDKNGTPIYEGDVVRCGANEFRPGEVFEVRYILNGFRYIQPDKPDETCYYAQTLTEVIGNIHENPELLKS